MADDIYTQEMQEIIDADGFISPFAIIEDTPEVYRWWDKY